MLIKLAGWGVCVSALFGIAVSITPIPEEYKQTVVVGVWACFALSCLGWILAFCEHSNTTLFKIADKYIESRNSTSNQESPFHLIRSGATELKSEKALVKVCSEIKKRTQFDPFQKWDAIPKGKRLEALRNIKDRGINIDDPEQCMDFLLDLNNVSAISSHRRPNLNSAFVELAPNPALEVISSKQVDCKTCGKPFLAQRPLGMGGQIALAGQFARCPTCGESNLLSETPKTANSQLRPIFEWTDKSRSNLRLRVKNEHTTKSALSVRARLVAIQCKNWVDENDEYRVSQLVPYFLPHQGKADETPTFEIAAQSDAAFDLAFLESGLTSRIVGIAPAIRDIRTPTIAYPCKFFASKFVDPEGRSFIFKIEVSGRDIPAKPVIGTLFVPSLIQVSNGLEPEIKQI